MQRTYICDAKQNDGKEIKICGFVSSYRDGKAMAFMILKDITSKIQVTIEKEKHPEWKEVLDEITQDSVVEVVGKVSLSEYVKMGGVEIVPSNIKICTKAEALPIAREYIPATKKKAAVEKSSIDQRIEYRWIDLRTEKNQLIFKVQTELVKNMRNYLLNKDFIEIHTPKLIGAASESGAEVFRLDYFPNYNIPFAYLAQSPQFYKQMAMSAGFEKIFEVGPVFRAEKSFTSKHATEFTCFDVEFSYINSCEDVMKLEEDMLTYALDNVYAKYGDKIKELFENEENSLDIIVPQKPFPRIKLQELYDALEDEYGYSVPKAERGDLTTEAEKLSYKWVKEHYGHEFLFITDYDAEKRAFYHMRDDNNIPQGYDLIWRGVEITTGAQREHRYDILKKQAEEKGLDKDVKFYLDFFKYGCPSHGGFGVGVDRLTMLLLGIPIKEAMFLFRGPSHITP